MSVVLMSLIYIYFKGVSVVLMSLIYIYFKGVCCIDEFDIHLF